jgi:hypothetical protein
MPKVSCYYSGGTMMNTENIQYKTAGIENIWTEISNDNQQDEEKKKKGTSIGSKKSGKH